MAEVEPESARTLTRAPADSEPDAGGWDAADTATGMPDEPAPAPAAQPARAVPGVERAPMLEPATKPVRPVAATSEGSSSSGGLGNEVRQEVWSIVRAGIEQAMGPIIARQRELEARLERAEREAERASRAQPAPAAPASSPAAPPVGPAAPAAQAAPLAPAPPPAAVKVAPIASIPIAIGSIAPAAFKPAPNPAPRLSLPPQGYGVSVVPEKRPSLDLSGVGPVEIDASWDGGRSKRRVVIAVVVIIVLIIVGVVASALASYS